MTNFDDVDLLTFLMQTYPDYFNKKIYESEIIRKSSYKYQQLVIALRCKDYSLAETYLKEGLSLNDWPELESYLILIFSSVEKKFISYAKNKGMEKNQVYNSFFLAEKIISLFLDYNLNPNTPVQSHPMWFYLVVMGNNMIFFSPQIIEKCLRKGASDKGLLQNSNFKNKLFTFRYRNNQRKLLTRDYPNSSEKRIFDQLQTSLLTKDFEKAKKLLSKKIDLNKWDTIDSFFLIIFEMIEDVLNQEKIYQKINGISKKYIAVDPLNPRNVFNSTEEIISFLFENNWNPNFLCNGIPFILYLVKLRNQDYSFSNEIILKCITKGADIYSLSHKHIPVYAYINNIKPLSDYLYLNDIRIPDWNP